MRDFQRGLTEGERPTLTVGSTVPQDGVLYQIEGETEESRGTQALPFLGCLLDTTDQAASSPVPSSEPQRQ